MKNKLFTILTTLSLLTIPLDTLALKKSETIYTNLNSDGSVYKSTVSNHLTHLNEEEIKDQTELKDIMNIGGNENFTQLGSNLTWNTTESDLYYKGKTDKEIPISTEIRYYLDGKKTTVEDIIGKSGHIRIEYHFQNKNKSVVKVQGQYTTLYTPYLTTLGTLLDSSSKNISISNGKVISNGSKNIVVGFASPGLYASTQIHKFSSLDMIAIEYDTDSFSLATTYIVSTPKIFEKKDLSLFDEIDTLSASIDSLSENMNSIDKGMSELNDGMSTLVGGSAELKNSLAYANSMMTKLKDGSIELDRGLDSMIESITNVKNMLTDPTNPDIQKITQVRTKNQLTINKLQTALLSSGIKAEDLSAACLDPTSSSPLLQNDTVAMFCLLSANDQTINTMSSMLTSNVDSILTALSQIKDGTTTLSTGLVQMETGMNKLYQGANTLYTGSNKLKAGSSQLATGTHTFKTQGIDKLSSTAKTFVSYGNKFEALAKLSADYRGFASNNAEETVFISMVKSVK